MGLGGPLPWGWSFLVRCLDAWSELGWGEWLKRCSISFLTWFSHLDLFLWWLRGPLSLPTFRRQHPSSLSSVLGPPLQRTILKCDEGGESSLEVPEVGRSFQMLRLRPLRITLKHPDVWSAKMAVRGDLRAIFHRSVQWSLARPCSEISISPICWVQPGPPTLVLCSSLFCWASFPGGECSARRELRRSLALANQRIRL